MKKARDIEMILSNLKVRPGEKARQAAFERMINRRAEVLAADSGSTGETRNKEIAKAVVRRHELSCEELAMAAGGISGESQSCPKCGLVSLQTGTKECSFCGWREDNPE